MPPPLGQRHPPTNLSRHRGRTRVDPQGQGGARRDRRRVRRLPGHIVHLPVLQAGGAKAKGRNCSWRHCGLAGPRDFLGAINIAASYQGGRPGVLIPENITDRRGGSHLGVRDSPGVSLAGPDGRPDSYCESPGPPWAASKEAISTSRSNVTNLTAEDQPMVALMRAGLG